VGDGGVDPAGRVLLRTEKTAISVVE